MDYETLLTKADVFGASVDGWALRAAEAAWAEADAAATANWIQRFLLTSPTRGVEGLATLRLADALVARGDAVAARAALDRVVEAHGTEPIGLLAEVRRVDLGIHGDDREAAIERLREAGRTYEIGLSQHARASLAHALREREDVDGALLVLARLSYESPPKELAPSLVSDIDAVMALAAARVRGGAGCTAFIERAGAHAATLARHASEPGPFLTLAKCYEHLRLPAVALEVHRTLIRAFGAALGEAAALPVARAAFATGDVGLARTAAVAGVRRGGPRANEWALLLGETELVEGRLEAAVTQLRPLVEAGLPEADPTAAIVAMARASVKRRGGSEDRTILWAALAGLSDAQAEAGGERLGEAAKLTAEIHRKLGESEAAA